MQLSEAYLFIIIATSDKDPQVMPSCESNTLIANCFKEEYIIATVFVWIFQYYGNVVKMTFGKLPLQPGSYLVFWSIEQNVACINIVEELFLTDAMKLLEITLHGEEFSVVNVCDVLFKVFFEKLKSI